MRACASSTSRSPISCNHREVKLNLDINISSVYVHESSLGVIRNSSQLLGWFNFPSNRMFHNTFTQELITLIITTLSLSRSLSIHLYFTSFLCHLHLHLQRLTLAISCLYIWGEKTHYRNSLLETESSLSNCLICKINTKPHSLSAL